MYVKLVMATMQTPPTITEINSKSILFAQSLINGSFDLEYLTFVSGYLNVTHINTAMLEKIGEFLRLQTSYLYVDVKTNVNKTKIITFGDLLMLMAKNDAHNVKGCSCSYHEESLLTHSLFAMFKTYDCINIDMPDRYILHISILALFHDIGKISCTKLYLKKNSLGFPFHGECGSGIMLQLFVKSIYFSRTEWENMCRAIGTHMCGYHCKDYTDKNTLYKMDLLCLERKRVTYMLEYLMYGDSLGKISKRLESEKDIIDRKKQFSKHVSKTFSATEFFKNYKLTGLLIKICGQSGCGKTTFCSHIIKQFLHHGVDAKNIVHIERDLVMCNVVLKILKPDAKPIKFRPMATEYNLLRDYYKTYKLANVVNDAIFKLIKDNRHKVIILDTVANYYCIDNLLPSICSSMFRININVIRGKPIDKKTCARMSLSMETQIKLFGDKTILSWLPKDINMHALTSCSTNTEINFKEKVQPHLVYQYVWKKDESYNVAIIDEMIEQISKQFTTNYDICEFLNTFQTVPKIFEYFNDQKYIVTKPKSFNNTITIKYMDHNKQFDKCWMRLVRGSAFYTILKEDLTIDRIICIKQLLPRGIEYLTSYHNLSNIVENENSFGAYDSHQMQIIERLNLNIVTPTSLSFKSDGSLFGLTIIPKSSEIYNLLLSSYNAKMEEEDSVLSIMFELCKVYDFMVLPCSQSTLVFGKEMMDYYASALCAYADIKILDDMTIIEAFNKGMNVMLRFLTVFNTMTDQLKTVNGDLIKCLSFEAVCNNRQSKWGTCHKELAVNYEKSMLLFLGCTFNIGITPGRFVPHFDLKLIPFACGFSEPAWWAVEKRTEIEAMLTDVELVACNLLNVEEFFSKYPPKNVAKNWNMIMDYEGFVMLTHISKTKYDYGKIKTKMFYACHKIKKEQLAYIMSLPECCENHFPVIKTVKNFYIELEGKCQSYVLGMKNFIDQCIDKTHAVYLEQDKTSKMMQTFVMRSRDVQIRMIMKAFKNINQHLLLIFSEAFSVQIFNTDEQFITKLAFDVVVLNVLFKMMNKNDEC